jgi:hypothetical protein
MVRIWVGCEQGLVPGWAGIVDKGFSQDTAEPFRKPMSRQPTIVAEVKYRDVAEECRGVRKQPQMTPVPDRVGAHDRDSPLVRLR